ncbi:MAG: protease complex subunit PrcB family protein [Tumebacillaceae bacterium]
MKKSTALVLAAGFVLMASSQVQASDKIIAGKIIAPAPVIAPSPIIAKQNTTTIQAHRSDTYTDLNGHFSARAVAHLTDMDLLPTGTTFQPAVKIDRKDVKAWIQKVTGATVKDSTPDAQNVTRIEVAQWLADTLPAMNTGIIGKEMLINPFDDTKGLSDDQRAAANKMYYLGIMVGDGSRHFSPNATMTRGEAAVLLDQAQMRTMSVAKPVTYENLNGALPESANTMFNENKTEQGLYSVTDNGVRYVLVSGGEVPTGGYSVTLDSVTETDAGIFVHASLHNPEAGAIVPQLVSYPHATIKITDVNKPVYLLADK